MATLTRMRASSSSVALYATVAAWLLLTPFLCLDDGEAHAHLIGAHDGAAANHAGTHDTAKGLTFAARVSHPECGDDAASAAVGVASVTIVPDVGGTAAACHDLTVPAAGTVSLTLNRTGSPPAEPLSTSPLRI